MTNEIQTLLFLRHSNFVLAPSLPPLELEQSSAFDTSHKGHHSSVEKLSKGSQYPYSLSTSWQL